MPNIILNNYCNQKCSYCFAEDSMTVQKSSLNTQKLSTYLQILRFLHKYQYTEVRLLGGEPLLHPNVKNILLLALKGGFNCLVFSNLNLPFSFISSIFKDFGYRIRINCNLNNKDFYSEIEYKNLSQNISFLQEQGHEIIIGYNIYNLDKSFDDIAILANELSIKRINLKVTNTIAGKALIIDTGSRKYGEYIFNIIKKYSQQFDFELSCGLSKDIFLGEELEFMKKINIDLRYGCSGFAGEFDIDIDGSIYKCFPTRQFYLGKGISISNFNPKMHRISHFGIPESASICAAHKL